MDNKKRMNVSSMGKMSFSSEKQRDPYRQTKSISATSTTSPFASKTQSSSNTWQKNSPQVSKANLNTGYKTSTSNIPTFKETTSKTNPNLSTGQKNSLAAFKTNSNYQVETKSFTNTFKTQPDIITGTKNCPHTFTTHSNLYIGPGNPRPAFQTYSKWPTAHPTPPPAFKVYPTFNNFPRNHSPAHLLGASDCGLDGDRSRIKDFVVKGQADTGRSPGLSQKNEDLSTIRNQPPTPSEPNRERAANRLTRQNTNENELNCPTCEATFLPKIYQCANGHSSCSSCKEKGWSCGICGEVITDMRNFALEDYLAEKKFLCPHNTEGCELVMTISEIYVHIEECPYRMLECPAGCSCKISLKQLSGHFDDQHPGQRLAGVGSEIELRYIYEPSQKVYLLEVGAFHFLFHEWVSAIDHRIYMAAQLIGTKANASKWFYEVHIYAKNEPHRVYTFSETCTSFVEPVVDVFDEGQCFVLTQKHAATFLYKAALNYKVFIKKIVENKPQTEFLLINLDD